MSRAAGEKRLVDARGEQPRREEAAVRAAVDAAARRVEHVRVLTKRERRQMRTVVHVHLGDVAEKRAQERIAETERACTKRKASGRDCERNAKPIRFRLEEFGGGQRRAARSRQASQVHTELCRIQKGHFRIEKRKQEDANIFKQHMPDLALQPRQARAGSR
eukprot:5699056-Pleurochrysis_carterae.AAC.4